MSQSSSLPPAPPGPQQASPAAPQAAHVAGERHVSSVAGSSGGFTKQQGAMLVGAATVAALSFVLLRPQAGPVEPKAGDDRLRVQAVSHYEPPPLPPATTPVSFPVLKPQVTPPVVPAQQSPLIGSLQQTPPDPLAKARRAPLLSFGAGGGGTPAASRGNGQEGENGLVRPDAVQPNELAARLQATPVRAVGATVLPHQPYLLTKGNTVPCVLQTAMDSTLPGFVTCKLPTDVIGKTGITLLDRGTLVVGETHGGMQQGQSRLFVLWTRAETPNGVVINLDSPAADALGRTGFDGEVQTHFWARLGGALLLSIVQGGLQTGVAAVGGGNNNFNTGGVQSLSSETLHNSVDIRPTLTKNQGELVSIFVARDLDFSGVYSVSTTPGFGRAGR